MLEIPPPPKKEVCTPLAQLLQQWLQILDINNPYFSVILPNTMLARPFLCYVSYIQKFKKFSLISTDLL